MEEKKGHTMCDSDEDHGLELCGNKRKRPLSLRDALPCSLFQRGTLDLFFTSAWYRIAPYDVLLEKQKLTVLTALKSDTVWEFKENQWVSCTTREFPCFFPVDTTTRLRHSLDKKVILFEAEGYSGILPVRAVLYPAGRPPTNGTLSIVGWASDNTPIFNGGYSGHTVSQRGPVR